MYFKQIVKEDLGCASYIVGCPNAGVCAVVDPRLDMLDDILALAGTKGMKITAVIETHNHADHISCHSLLAQRTGADIYVHEKAQAEYPHKNLKDGDVLRFGVVKMRVMHTPGHRPEHIALTVADTSRSEEPWLVLTGDSLFIGDVARPDLAVPGEEGASILYDSIFGGLLKLDDGVEVYPAHVAGSLCGRGMNTKTSSTIGYERKYNAAVAPRSRAVFVHDMNENLPQRPPNMYKIVERNRRDYGPAGTPEMPAPLDARAFQRAMQGGTPVIDTRLPDEYAKGHIAGVLHVALRGSAFPTRVGFVASPENRLLLVVSNESDLRDAITELAVVGYNRVSGYLAGGMAGWQAASDTQVQTLNQLTVEQLCDRLHELPVLDVRDASEWDEGHIEDAIHVPYYFIEQRLQEQDNELEPYRSQALAVICGSGQRSTIACSILQRHGFTQLLNIKGGMEAWNEKGFATV